MSTFTTEPIQTLTEWNAVLAGGCCCEMPECPIVTKECQSLTRTATSEDDDYTDAMAAWIAGGSVGPEPEKPAGYDDVTHGSWLPFTEPPDEPTLYRTLETADEETIATGTVYRWSASSGDESFEADASWSVWTGGPEGVSLVSTVWRYAYDGGICGGNGGYTEVVEGEADEVVAGFPEPTDPAFEWVVDDPPVGEPCTATTRELVSESRHADAGGSATNGSGLGDSCNTGPPPPITADPTGWPSANDWQWTDLEEKLASLQTLASPVTKEDVRDRAEGKIPAWPETAESADCTATYTADWPGPGDWPDPWPDCQSLTLPIEAIGTCQVRKNRFRWLIPDTFQGTWFKVTWDILEEPEGWDATIPDPENPTGPEIPDPDRPARSFFAKDQTWEWTGPGNSEDPDSWKSPWNEIPPPDVPGERRVVNAKLECYRGPFGSRPQPFGEQVDRLDGEEDGLLIDGTLDLGTLPPDP